jgi:hypothetical protein
MRNACTNTVNCKFFGIATKRMQSLPPSQRIVLERLVLHRADSCLELRPEGSPLLSIVYVVLGFQAIVRLPIVQWAPDDEYESAR